MQTRILYLFTRTPLHVGAGSSVGAIDQPIQRERHTGFPVIPASSLKGSFADQWPTTLKTARLTTKKVQKGDKEVTEVDQADDAAWLFGSDTTDLSFAGSLLFSEARVLAFPIRSAKGSYAWITCPLMLQRAARDGVFGPASKPDAPNKLRDALAALDEPDDGEANYEGNRLDLQGQVVLEEYCLKQAKVNEKPRPLPSDLAAALAGLVPDDALFATITERLVILSNGMMSHFATTACEVAQHVRISDETGTADGGGLFNQENVPADTLFYSVLHATAGRGEHFKTKKADEAITEFKTKVDTVQVFQFGGDASTGLGFCSVHLNDKKGA